MEAEEASHFFEALDLQRTRQLTDDGVAEDEAEVGGQGPPIWTLIQRFLYWKWECIRRLHSPWAALGGLLGSHEGNCADLADGDVQLEG